MTSIMSGDQEEPMDVDSSDDKLLTKTNNADKDANEDAVTVTLSVNGLQDITSKKYRTELQKALQSFFNKNSTKADVQVISASQYEALLKIAPASAKDELVTGQDLICKENGKPLKIISVNVTPSTATAPIDNSSAASTASQNVCVGLQEQSTGDSAGDEKYTQIVPVNQFWYVNHICKDAIQRIERENGVKIIPEVKVNFTVNQEDGNAEKASADFANLVQSQLCEFRSSSVPLKKVASWMWEKTLQVMKKSDDQLLLTVSSEEIIASGPSQRQYAINKLLQNTSISTDEQDEEYVSSFPHITEKARHDLTWHGMSIKDPAIGDGLPIDEDDWKLITTSYSKDLQKIKAKFGVDFKESGFTQGKTIIKTYHKSNAGNCSMESHAARALLRLYQKVTTSPLNPNWFLGDSSKNQFSVDEVSKGASAGSFLNGQSRNTETSTVRGTTGGKDEAETCPICLDTFANKTQLKCKHEFCNECLDQSVKTRGAICPVCKDVFGLIEGDQPDGTMTWRRTDTALHGYEYCGTIHITYDIKSGIQTEKHPKPGTYYSGISRTAYLPDNSHGREVLRLLKKAFDQKLIFTIGVSRTTGLDNQVTWNDIHHKTSMTGGPQSFGYPDPSYLTRVKEELQAKGIV